jgi:hypothetical protein
MDIRDYLIELAGKNWSVLFSGWSALLPSSFTLWMVNLFGDAFVVANDGAVHMLDVGAGLFKPIADSRDHFAKLVDADNNANDWFMIPVVDRCVGCGMLLNADQCYGYKVPPLLGGTYEIDNIEPTGLSVHYGLLGSIFKQTKGMPDGTLVSIVALE